MSESNAGVPAILQYAHDEGTKDVFAGKRAYGRYNIGVSTELTTNPAEASASWSVVTHNVSGGGVGVWSRQRLAPGTPVHVRDTSNAHGADWLPGSVEHCSVGLRGYLLGISFDFPVSADDVVEPEAVEPDARPADALTGKVRTSRTNPVTAQTRHIVCGAASALVAFIVSRQISGTMPAPAILVAHALTSALAGGLVGYLFGCIYARIERRDVRALRQMIRDVSEGRTPATPASVSTTRDLGALYGSLRDLGSRLRLREEDERLQRQNLEDITQIKSNILAIVSHDMRTPLTSILLYAQMLLDEADDLGSPECQSFLGIIHSECTRLSRLVDDLLEVQRLESDRASWDIRSHDLTETVRSCVEVFDAMAKSKTITLRVKCDRDLPPIEVDADKLSQVLSNLVSNALKYTEPGGTVEVSARLQGSDCILSVADSGPGIARDQWDQIFDRFTQIRDLNTSDIAGVGLGLYIVRKIVEHHGGCIWVNSEVGKGSEFVVSIPIKPQLEAQPSRLPAFVGRKVVVCDSDPELAAMVSLVLRREGLDVRTAHSANRLMEHVDHGDVDLVIADVLLPDAGGTELLARLMDPVRKNYRVIVHSYEGDAKTFGAKGIDVFLRRPVSRDDLLAAVQRALQKRSDEGHNIVTVDDGSVNIERLHEYFIWRGHTPMLAESVQQAGQFVDEYAIDCVILPEAVLDPEWSALGQAPFSANPTTKVIVVCKSFGRHHRELAGATGATVVTVRPGCELDLVDVAVASTPAVTSEFAR